MSKYIHFIEFDLDHYGVIEDINQDSTGCKNIKEYEEYLGELYGSEFYRSIKVSDIEYFFIIGGNIRIHAWESYEDLMSKKVYRHPVRYQDAKTIHEHNSMD